VRNVVVVALVVIASVVVVVSVAVAFVVVAAVVVIKHFSLLRPMLKHASNFYLHLLSSVPQIIIIILRVCEASIRTRNSILITYSRGL